MSASTGEGKGRPTPKRKDQERRNYRPLVGNKKEAKAREKELRQKRFEKEQEGLRTGREDLLPAYHQGKARRYVRNWIDARYTFIEWMIIIVLVLMFASMIFGAALANGAKEVALMFNTISMLASWAVMIIALVEGIILARMVNKRVQNKFEPGDIPRGLRWYAFSRMLQPRRWRSPRPQVKRREKID